MPPSLPLRGARHPFVAPPQPAAAAGEGAEGGGEQRCYGGEPRWRQGWEGNRSLWREESLGKLRGTAQQAGLSVSADIISPPPPLLLSFALVKDWLILLLLSFV